MTTTASREKQHAGIAAISHVKNGMHLGLGTGTTAEYAIRELGRRVQLGELRVTAVATSLRSAEIAREYGIVLEELEPAKPIDVYIDGADEVDSEGSLIKGGGGALFREKMVARHARRGIIVVDSAKLVDRLGAFPLPVDIVPFASAVTAARISETAGCRAEIRRRDNEPFRTNDGNFVIDCHFENGIADAKGLESALIAIPGVVDCGLFIGLCDEVIIGTPDGVKTRQIERRNKGFK